MALHTERCVACRRGSPRVTADEIAELHPQIPEWLVSDVEGTKKLEKGFKFRDFAGALEFARRVGELAEQEGHHPRIVLEWAMSRFNGGPTRSKDCIGTTSSWQLKPTAFMKAKRAGNCPKHRTVYDPQLIIGPRLVGYTP